MSKYLGGHLNAVTCEAHSRHKPNVHGGPARKKARIVICGNFQEVHPDELIASKTPSYPSLRMALSVACHMGWPIECQDVSTAFRDARLFGYRDTDLGDLHETSKDLD